MIIVENSSPARLSPRHRLLGDFPLLRALALSTLVSSMAVCLLAPPAYSQPCPGMSSTFTGAGAWRSSYVATSPTQPLKAFIGTGCTAQIIGTKVTACPIFEAPNYAQLQANWASLGARTGDATGGCSFMCQNGDCVVRNDGLPVELLGFGVD